jgi:tRNA 2-thiouridine synthesizing protein A
MTDADPITELDCIGLLCPLPVLKSRRALRGMAEGARLSVRSTDPMAVIDIPHMCATDGHTLIEQRRDGETTVFLIARGPDRPA